jgi:hypothetical protein
MTKTEDDLKRKAKMKGWGETALEVGKWALVVWLLLPIVEFTKRPVSIGRVVAGICLFVVFAGKLFYDTLIMEFVRQRRYTAKQDILTLLGMILATVLLVGFVIVMVGLLLGQWQKSALEGVKGE